VSTGPTYRYIVTVHDTGNITDKAANIHTILTSRDYIAPRERVSVEPAPIGEHGAARDAAWSWFNRTVESVAATRAAGESVTAKQLDDRYNARNACTWLGIKHGDLDVSEQSIIARYTDC
jgi:hypothetical protein